MSLPDWTHLPFFFASLWVIIDLGMRVAALGVIPGKRKPSTGMAWLLLVLLNPIIGFIGFLFFGSNQVGRKRGEKIRAALDLIRERTESLPEPDETVMFRPAVRGALTLNKRLGALPLTSENVVRFEPDYYKSIAAMTARVDTAEHYVDVEFYISALDDVTRDFFRALGDARKRGVKVRFLFDHIGSKGSQQYKDMLAFFAEHDIEWYPMLPIEPLKGNFRRPDLRNHRKLLVVDGLVGFTGSMNMIERGYNKAKNHRANREWVELVVEVEGPVVASLEMVFASDWWIESDEILLPIVAHAASGRVPETEDTIHDVVAQVIPSGPGIPKENSLRLFTTLIYAAERRLSITSPYFVPDESLLYAITTAAKRGVQVELFVSETSDQFMVGHAQASYYAELLEAGVRIYQYPDPFILHSKHFTVDDDVAVVGSSNMDMRSFSLNYEISLMMIGEEPVSEMREVEDEYRRLSRELTLDEWRQRKPGQKYLDNVFRLTSALQ